MTVAAANRLRANVAGLTTLAQRDLAALWRDVRTAVQARRLLDDVLPALIETYGSAAASLAADAYDELREQQNIDGRFHALTPQLRDVGATELAGWATAEAERVETVLALVNGGMQRRIFNAARETTIGSTLADPAADGWQRVARPDGCMWCQMLAGRAELYRTEDSATFAAHDSCACTVTPAWGGRERPVKPYTPSPRYSDDESGRAKKAADQARAKQWIADHL